jgi:hypothetical protein
VSEGKLTKWKFNNKWRLAKRCLAPLKVDHMEVSQMKVDQIVVGVMQFDHTEVDQMIIYNMDVGQMKID